MRAGSNRHPSVPCGLVRNTVSALGCVHLPLQRLDTKSSNATIVGSTLVLVDRGGILPRFTSTFAPLAYARAAGRRSRCSASGGRSSTPRHGRGIRVLLQLRSACNRRSHGASHPEGAPLVLV